jgi:hypothetical protein
MLGGFHGKHGNEQDAMADEGLSFQLRNIFRKIANHHPASDRDGAVEVSEI